MFKHLLVGEAQDGDAPTAEEGVAKSVTSLSLSVERTVHLDGQPRFDAEEVGKVVADGKLSTELEVVDLSAAEADSRGVLRGGCGDSGRRLGGVELVANRESILSRDPTDAACRLLRRRSV